MTPRKRGHYPKWGHDQPFLKGQKETPVVILEGRVTHLRPSWCMWDPIGDSWLIMGRETLAR